MLWGDLFYFRLFLFFSVLSTKERERTERKSEERKKMWRERTERKCGERDR